MKIAYLDCSSGISGDMFIGALVGAGVPLSHIRRELSRIPLPPFRLSARPVLRGGVSAIHVSVGPGKEVSVARKWRDVRRIIRAAQVERAVKDDAYRLFERLFELEAEVHGQRMEDAHLHELGAVDCLVDVFSVLIGLRYLGIGRVYSSPVNLGHGSVRTEHGMLTVPAPVTAELMRDAEVYSAGSPMERTTPTGALLLWGVSEGFGPLPAMRLTKTGCGAGRADDPERPNVLRVLVGESVRGETVSPPVFLVEANIDDMNPQFYDHVFDVLFACGALDVYLTPVIMKKQRPAIKLSALVDASSLESLTAAVLRETSSIGVRYCRYERVLLKREQVRVMTEFGRVTFKRVFTAEMGERMIPEYDDCKSIARKRGLPIRDVYERLLRVGR